MLGDKIFTRSAWGRNQAKAELGIPLKKANTSSVDVAISYWHSQAYMFEHLGLAIDELLLYVGELNPTHNGDEVRQALHDQWNRYRLQFTDTREKKIYRDVIVNTGTFFKTSGGIGRQQLKQKILIELCNSLSAYLS